MLAYRGIVAHIRQGSVTDVAAVVRLFDRAVEWLVANGRAAQWGTVPFSVQPHLVAQISEAATSGAMRVAELGTIDGSVAVNGAGGGPGVAPVGAMWLAEAPGYAPPPDRPELYLQGLVVDRAWQGHKIGRTLLDHAVEEARRLGAAQVRLDCWAGGDQALVHYYELAGFTRTASVTVANRWPGMVMTRQVSPGIEGQ
jgi:GNAT superfamily N-acetyltransferase